MEIFRAISELEKLDLEENRKFKAIEGVLECKLFAESHEDALKFGRSFSPFDKKPFFIVKVIVEENFQNKFEKEYLDSFLKVGITYAVNSDLLDEFNNNIIFTIIDEVYE